MTILPTSSSLALCEKCPPSHVLPQSEQRDTRFADEGAAVDAFIQHRDLSRVPEEYRARCAAIDLDAIPQGLHQVVVGWNWRTGEAFVLRPLDEHRAYPKIPDVVWGTMDIVQGFDGERVTGVVAVGGEGAGTQVTRTVIIDDVKGGLAGRVTEPLRNLQLGLGALCFAKVFSLDAVTVGLLFVGFGGAVRTVRVTLDAFALDCVEAQIREVLQRWEACGDLAAGRPLTLADVNPGLWCTEWYCDAKLHCPAHQETQTALAKGQKQTMLDQIDALLLEQPSKAYALWQVMKGMTAEVGARVTGHARQLAIKLVGGRVYGEHEVDGKVEIDPDIGWNVLQHEHPQYAIKGVRLEINSTSVSELAALVAPKGKAAAEKRRLLGLIEKAGGLARKTVRKLEEHVPKKSGELPGSEVGGTAAPVGSATTDRPGLSGGGPADSETA